MFARSLAGARFATLAKGSQATKPAICRRRRDVCVFSSATMASSTWGVDKIPDLKGKTYVVVGASAGLGFIAAKELAKHNAHVVLTARNDERGNDAMTNIRKEVGQGGSMDLMHVDVADFHSVEKFAADFKAKGYPLHCLILNAGIFLVDHEKTPDGFEITQKTNHFGLFLLALLLADKLKESAPARMVWVASPAETFSGNIDWDDLKGAKDNTSDLHMYGRTKLFNIMSSNEFNRRLAGTGVESYACHPGVAKTDLYRKMDKDEKLSAKTMDVGQGFFGQSDERGALSMLYCATEPALAGQGGKYYGPNNLQLFNTAERGTFSKEPWDEAACARLYTESRRILEETLGKPVPDIHLK